MISTDSLTQLGARVETPASPEAAILETVPFERGDGPPAIVRFTCPGIHLALPRHRPAGLRPHRHRLRSGQAAGGIQIAEAVHDLLPQSRRIPRGLHGHDRSPHHRGDHARSGCGSPDTGIRAAAFRSTSSGRPARRRREPGFPKPGWRRIAGAVSSARKRLRPTRTGTGSGPSPWTSKPGRKSSIPRRSSSAATARPASGLQP